MQNPAASKPPPNDDETVRAMAHAAELLERVAAAHPGLGVAAPAARLGRALSARAQGEPRQRERAWAVLISGLVATLGQLRSAMQASPVTLATLPDEIKRDWIASHG